MNQKTLIGLAAAAGVVFLLRMRAQQAAATTAGTAAVGSSNAGALNAGIGATAGTAPNLNNSASWTSALAGLFSGLSKKPTVIDTSPTPARGADAPAQSGGLLGALTGSNMQPINSGAAWGGTAVPGQGAGNMGALPGALSGSNMKPINSGAAWGGTMNFDAKPEPFREPGGPAWGGSSASGGGGGEFGYTMSDTGLRTYRDGSKEQLSAESFDMWKKMTNGQVFAAF